MASVSSKESNKENAASVTLRFKLQGYEFLKKELEESEKNPDRFKMQQSSRNYNHEKNSLRESEDQFEVKANNTIVDKMNLYLSSYIERADVYLEALRNHVKDDKEYEMFYMYYAQLNEKTKKPYTQEEIASKYGKEFSMKINRAVNSIFQRNEIEHKECSLSNTEKGTLLKKLARAYKSILEYYLSLLGEREILQYEINAVTGVKRNETGAVNSPDPSKAERYLLKMFGKKDELEDKIEACNGLIGIFDDMMMNADYSNYSICRYQLMREMVDKGYKKEFIKKIGVSSGNYNEWINKLANDVVTENEVVVLRAIIKCFDENEIGKMKLSIVQNMLLEE